MKLLIVLLTAMIIHINCSIDVTGHNQSGESVYFKAHKTKYPNDTLFFQPLYYHRSNVIQDFKQCDTASDYFIVIDSIKN